MSFLIDLAKAYNIANTELILSTQELSAAITSLKPYSACVQNDRASFVPKGDYKRVSLSKAGSVVIKKVSFDFERKVSAGIYLPLEFTDRIYIKTNIDKMKWYAKSSIALAKTKDELEKLVAINKPFYRDNEAVSSLLKSINFDSRTADQIQELNTLTMKELKEDRENTIHSWIKYYPIPFCCYGVVL